VNFTPRPLYPKKSRIPSEQEAGLAPKPGWMFGEEKNSLVPTVFELWNVQPIALSLYCLCCPAPSIFLQELCLNKEYLDPAII